jgi:hypothetical protein
MKKPPFEVRQIIKQLLPNIPEMLEYREYVFENGQREFMPHIISVVKTGEAWLKIIPDASEGEKPIELDKRYSFKAYKKFNHEKELKRIWERSNSVQEFKEKMLNYINDIVDIKKGLQGHLNPQLPII